MLQRDRPMVDVMGADRDGDWLGDGWRYDVVDAVGS